MGAATLNLAGKWLLLGEGKADSSFLRCLLDTHGIGHCIARSPSDFLPDGGGGKSRFSDVLSGLSLQETFPKMLGVVVLADNDDDPARRFAETASAIRDSRHYAVPDKEETVAKSPSKQSSAIYMLPSSGQRGSLEDLVWSVASRCEPSRVACVEQYVACAGAAGWDPPKAGKTRVQAFLATHCKSDPNVPLSQLWSKPEKLPLNGPELEPLVQFLKGLPL